MNKFERIFGLNEKLGKVGFLTLWSSAFFTSFIVLLVDDSTGAARNFCAVSQLACCTNLVSLGYSVMSNKSWSKAVFFTMNFDTFATWTAFAYFGGTAVFGTTPLGVWNAVQIAFTILNTLNGIAALYLVSKDHSGFEEYLTETI